MQAAQGLFMLVTNTVPTTGDTFDSCLVSSLFAVITRYVANLGIRINALLMGNATAPTSGSIRRIVVCRIKGSRGLFSAGEVCL